MNFLCLSFYGFLQTLAIAFGCICYSRHITQERREGSALTCGPSTGPFLAGRPCESSAWLGEEEAGKLTMLCREWFSWARRSTSARASWKRQLRNSRSSLVFRCQPSISSQRCRRARLLRRRASEQHTDEGGQTVYFTASSLQIKNVLYLVRQTLK